MWKSFFLLFDDENEPPKKKRLWVRDIFENRGILVINFNDLYFPAILAHI